jgi:hypothetical protein
MPTVSEFVAESTESRAKTFLETYRRLPENLRKWRPLDKGRSAADQFAECALLNLATAQLIESRQWPPDADGKMSFSIGGNDLETLKAELIETGNHMETVFEQNLAVLIPALRNVDEDQLTEEIILPWGPQTLAQIITYPLWNMSYHEGQVNYISFLGEE